MLTQVPNWRPTTPALAGRVPTRASVCASVHQVTTTQAQARVLGLRAVSIRVRTAPTFGLGMTTANAMKINYISGTAKAIEATGTHQVQLAKVKGGDAHGIPPRGRPV